MELHRVPQCSDSYIAWKWGSMTTEDSITDLTTELNKWSITGIIEARKTEKTYIEL